MRASGVGRKGNIARRKFRRAGKELTVSWGRAGTQIEWGLIGLMAAVILGLGIYGYFAPAAVRILTSIWQIVVLIGGIVVSMYLPIFKLGQVVG